MTPSSRGITQTGMGKLIEHVCIFFSSSTQHLLLTVDMYMFHLNRTIPFDALLGGAEA